MDVVNEADTKKLTRIKFGRSVETRPISAVTGYGVRELLDEMWKVLNKK